MSVKEAIERLYDWDDIDVFLRFHLKDDWLAYANEVDAMADANLRRAWATKLARNIPVEDAPAFLKWSAGLGRQIHSEVLMELGKERLEPRLLKPSPDPAISYSHAILATWGLGDPNTEAHAVAWLLYEYTPNSFETNVLAVKNLTASGTEEQAALIVSKLAGNHAPGEVISFAGNRADPVFASISWRDVFFKFAETSPAEALERLGDVAPSARPDAYDGFITGWRVSDPDGLAIWMEENQPQK